MKKIDGSILMVLISPDRRWAVVPFAQKEETIKEKRRGFSLPSLLSLHTSRQKTIGERMRGTVSECELIRELTVSSRRHRSKIGAQEPLVAPAFLYGRDEVMFSLSIATAIERDRQTQREREREKKRNRLRSQRVYRQEQLMLYSSVRETRR